MLDAITYSQDCISNYGRAVAISLHFSDALRFYRKEVSIGLRMVERITFNSVDLGRTFKILLAKKFFLKLLF